MTSSAQKFLMPSLLLTTLLFSIPANALRCGNKWIKQGMLEVEGLHRSRQRDMDIARKIDL